MASDAVEFPNGHFGKTALSTQTVVSTTGIKVVWGVIVATTAASVTFEKPDGTDYMEPIALSIAQVVRLGPMNFDGGLALVASAAVSVHLHYVAL
jgi:hypothetical protein